jgi:hypothetical protein
MVRSKPVGAARGRADRPFVEGPVRYPKRVAPIRAKLESRCTPVTPEEAYDAFARAVGTGALEVVPGEEPHEEVVPHRAA